MNKTERTKLIAKIAQLPTQLENLTAVLSDAQLTTHFLPNEWTVAQNVHHVADSHMNSMIRMKLILTEEMPTLRPYLQDDWALLADGTPPDLQNSLLLLKGLHSRWVLLFESLSEAQWQRKGLHPDIGEVSVEDILISYAAHGEGHIDQIQRTLAAEPT